MARDKVKQEYVLITSANFPRGGAAATYLNLFCKGMQLNGETIRVLLLKGFAFGKQSNCDKRHNTSADGIPFSYIGFTKRPIKIAHKLVDDAFCLIRLHFALLALLPKRKSTSILIFNNEIQYNIPIYLFCKLVGIPIITLVAEYFDKSVFSGSLGRRFKWFGFLFGFNYLFKLSSKLIVFSHFLKEKYIQQGVIESNIIIQPNLTDFDYWKIDKSVLKYTLGYSGTPSMKDGLFDLLNAIALLRKKGLDTTLLIIGDTVFGESLIPKLKVECSKLGVSDLITFTGLVDSSAVKQHLSTCKILTLTRPRNIQTEAGFPTKLGEYFASGKQILMTNFGDIETYFEKDSEMIIAECGDIEDIANKIEWIIKHPAEANTIAQKGYKKAKSMLEYQASVKNICDNFFDK